jgi:DNA ligase-1
MKRFTQLFSELDETNRTSEKVAALEQYFRAANPRDAAWALFFLCGRTVPRGISSTTLRILAAEESGLPLWLVEESYDAVGDSAEAIALLLPDNSSSTNLPLHRVVEDRLLSLRHLPEQSKRNLLLQTWRELDRRERFIWNKLITGAFRVGVAQTLVVRSLATVAGIEQSVMAHRLMGQWKPTAEDYQRLLSGETASTDDSARPYPFFLAAPLEGEPSALGEIAEWQAEWKWDGIRAQLIRRGDDVLLWSRGDEIVSATFPEIVEASRALPNGTVLDGEILAWRDDHPQPFARLQRRLGRKQVSEKMRNEVPVVFLAYDLLEWRGEDWRARSLDERRQKLESVMADAQQQGKEIVTTASRNAANETLELFAANPPTRVALPLRLSEILRPTSWPDLSVTQRESRMRQVEGIMLKRRSSTYGVGRQRGDWWKWKIDPFVVDAVLIQAQPGSGRRAGLYTDYTFGVWANGSLVPVAKAYSGLNDEEVRQVDAFVRANTIDKFGPVRTVKPVLVFELAFEGIQASTRHKAGIAVRFPRMNRWRNDKKAEEANTLEDLQALVTARRA